MKKSALAIAVAAAATASGAHAWDNVFFNNTVSPGFDQFVGQSPVYAHPFHQIANGQTCTTTEYAAGGGACPAATGITETQVIEGFSGGFDASGNALATATSKTVTCTDTGAWEADAVTGVFGWNQNGATLNAGAGTSVLADITGAPTGGGPNSCSVQLSATGKLAGGHYQTSVNIPAYGLIIDSYKSIDHGYTVVLDQCSSTPDYTTEVEPQLVNWIATRDPGDFDTSGFTATGCVLSTMLEQAYLTCDVDFSCGQFAKSVPVPAFAAGALGLGMLGITLVTSRRRRAVR